MRRRAPLLLPTLAVAGCCDPDLEVRVPEVPVTTADTVVLVAVVALLAVAAGLAGWFVRRAEDDDPLANGPGRLGVAVAGVAGALCLGNVVLAVVAGVISGDGPTPGDGPLVQGLVTTVVANDAHDVNELVGPSWVAMASFAIAAVAGDGLRRSKGRGADAGWSALVFLAGAAGGLASYSVHICPNAELRNDGLELLRGSGVAAGVAGAAVGLGGVVTGVVGSMLDRRKAARAVPRELPGAAQRRSG